MTELGNLNNRQIIYQPYSINGDWINALPLNDWLMFIITDNLSNEELFEIADQLIDKKACYLCCTGMQGEDFHDIVDNNLVLRNIENNQSAFDVVTTWHENIENGFWYSIFAAIPDHPVSTVFCLDASLTNFQSALQHLVTQFGEGYLPADES
ncbi:hypothetical protein GCM10023149_18100 [Mucilaginibacter gynuensis]|uniref:DUF7684 domain-containing protein n=1 Tax=Mucilaginibacter gynuensis TaxID=1302236 RepID=A0ABP8G891_9SPHI